MTEHEHDHHDHDHDHEHHHHEHISYADAVTQFRERLAEADANPRLPLDLFSEAFPK